MEEMLIGGLIWMTLREEYQRIFAQENTKMVIIFTN
jgi:hypothetical protein